MAHLNLTVDDVLTTTRAVRKRLDFDRPVEFDVLRECLSIAVQSPTGSMGQFWQFVMVDDPGRKQALADLYRRAWPLYVEQPFSIYNLHRDDPEMQPAAERAGSSAEYLVEHLHRAPWFMLPLLKGRYEDAPLPVEAAVWGSILPAVWSFMLAARERGLGTCWTTCHLTFEKEAAEILDIPFDDYTQVALIPIAYTVGTDFKAAPRKELDQFIHMNGWQGG